MGIYEKRKNPYDYTNEPKNVNEYDDGSIWSSPLERTYNKNIYNGDLERQKRLLGRYPAMTEKDQLQAPRNQMNYFTNQLNTLGYDVPEPEIKKKKTNPFTWTLGKVFDVLELTAGTVSNSIAGSVNRIVDNTEQHKWKDKNFLTATLDVLKGGFDSGKATVTSVFNKNNREGKVYWTDVLDNVRDTDSKLIKNTLGALVNAADFVNPLHLGSNLVGGVLDVLGKDDKADSVRKFGDKASEVVNGLALDILIGNKTQIGNLGKAIKVLQQVDDANVLKTIGSLDNFNEAKNAIKKLYEPTIRDNIKRSLGNKTVTTEEFEDLVRTALNTKAENSYKGLIERTRNAFDGAGDFKGVTFGKKVVLSRETLENLAKNEKTNKALQATMTALNPFSYAYSKMSGAGMRGLKNNNPLANLFVGGKDQDLLRNMAKTYDNYKGGSANLEDLYTSVGAKFKSVENRNIEALSKLKDRKALQDIDEAIKYYGIDPNELTNALETNGMEYTKQVDEIVEKINPKYQAEARDYLKGQIDSVKEYKEKLRRDLFVASKKSGDDINTNVLNNLAEQEVALDGKVVNIADYKKGAKELTNDMFTEHSDMYKVNETGELLYDNVNITALSHKRGRRTGQEALALAKYKADTEAIMAKNVIKNSSKKADEVLTGYNKIQKINKEINLYDTLLYKNPNHVNAPLMKEKLEYLHQTKKAYLNNMSDQIQTITQLDDVERVKVQVENVKSAFNIDEINKNLKETEDTISKLSALYDDNDGLLKYFEESGARIDNPKFIQVQEAFDKTFRVNSMKGKNEDFVETANDIKELFIKIGREEDLVKIDDALDYYNYVTHMLNPKNMDNPKVKEIAKKLELDLSDPFNVKGLNRKLHGSIEDLNKLMKNEYGIDNFFETNIQRILADRVTYNHSYMTRKHRVDLLNSVAKQIDVLTIDDLEPHRAKHLAKQLGVEPLYDDIKGGLGEDVKLIDPKMKTRQGNKTVGTTVRSYTGVRTNTIKELMEEGMTKAAATEYVDEIVKRYVNDYVGKIYKGGFTIGEEEATLLAKNYSNNWLKGEFEHFEQMTYKKGISKEKLAAMRKAIEEQGKQKYYKTLNQYTGMESKKLSKEEAYILANLKAKDDGVVALKDYEWLPIEEKEFVKYSPEEEADAYKRAIKQKIFKIAQGTDDRFALVNVVEETEDVGRRIVKEDIVKSREYVENMHNAMTDAEQSIFRTLFDEGKSLDEIAERLDTDLEGIKLYASKFIDDVKYEKYGNTVSLPSDTYENIEKKLIKQEYTIIDKTMADSYRKMTENLKQGDRTKVGKIYDRVMNLFKAWAVTSTGFHLNNIVGGVFNNALQVGMDSFNPKVHKDTMKLIHQLKKVNYDYTKLTGMTYGVKNSELGEQIVNGGLLSGFFDVEIDNLNDFKKGVTDKFIDEKSLFKTAFDNVNPFDLENNKILSTSRKFGEVSEQQMKVANFMAHIKNGRTPQAASDFAIASMFDYNDLTLFEEGVIKKYIAPFYTFTAKNIPFQFERMANNPMPYYAMNRVYKEFYDKNATEKEKMLTPDYLQNTLRIGGNKVIDVQTPFHSLTGLTNPSNIYSMLNPVIRTIPDFAYNRNTATGEDISKTNSPLEKIMYSAKQLNPVVGHYAKAWDIIGGEGIKRERALQWLKGNKVKTFDIDKAEKQTMYEYVNQLEALYYKLLEENPQYKDILEEEKQKKSKAKQNRFIY